MSYKSINFGTNVQQFIHRIPAGMQKGDKSTEIFACRETKKLYAISDGQTIAFRNLPDVMVAQLMEQFTNDPKAMEDLKHLSLMDALDEFTFCMYGAADYNGDFDENGVLKKQDNFICSDNCKCLKWNSKRILINGNELTLREIQVVQLLASDLPDKLIAYKLGISCSTLDTHKQHIFEKAGVQSKVGLIVKATEAKIIQ